MPFADFGILLQIIVEAPEALTTSGRNTKPTKAGNFSPPLTCTNTLRFITLSFDLGFWEFYKPMRNWPRPSLIFEAGFSSYVPYRATINTEGRLRGFFKNLQTSKCSPNIRRCQFRLLEFVCIIKY